MLSVNFFSFNLGFNQQLDRNNSIKYRLCLFVLFKSFKSIIEYEIFFLDVSMELEILVS